MSHVTTIAVEINDLEAVKAICSKLGLEFKENQKTFKWYGRHVGDYPLPEGFTKADMGKCDHALSVKGKPQAYEVGLANRGDHYVPLWDFWQGGYGLEQAVGKDGNKLISAYAEEVAIRKAKAFAKQKGFTFSQTVNPRTQETVITLRKY